MTPFFFQAQEQCGCSSVDVMGAKKLCFRAFKNRLSPSVNIAFLDLVNLKTKWSVCTETNIWRTVLIFQLQI